MTTTNFRPTAVAGTFYPNDAHALQIMVDELLQQAKQYTLQPKAIIAPHAGYIYSGSTAAEAYATLARYANVIKKVVVLGPAHTTYFKGIACDQADYFTTPLGSIPVDKLLKQSVQALPFVHTLPEAHTREHCLEVQLPFCQRVLDQFTVLPMVVGDTPKEDVMQLLKTVWGGPETLLIISSDLSHYLTYSLAQQKDSHTCASIDKLEDRLIEHDGACGYYPLRGFIAYARTRGMIANRLKLCNSGDTAGDKSRVVGYAAYHFYEQVNLGQYCGDDLLEAAEQTIQTQASQGIEFKYDPQHYSDVVNLHIPSFVTLMKQGQLRGCMGSLTTNTKLITNVIHNAYRAAFADPRFTPVQSEELDQLSISISLLTPLTPMSFNSYDQMLAKLTPGKDGLLLKLKQYQATFLPSVWDSLPDKQAFVEHLLIKMGLEKTFWSPQMQAWTYQAEYLHNSPT